MASLISKLWSNELVYSICDTQNGIYMWVYNLMKHSYWKWHTMPYNCYSWYTEFNGVYQQYSIIAFSSLTCKHLSNGPLHMNWSYSSTLIIMVRIIQIIRVIRISNRAAHGGPKKTWAMCKMILHQHPWSWVRVLGVVTSYAIFLSMAVIETWV